MEHQLHSLPEDDVPDRLLVRDWQVEEEDENSDGHDAKAEGEKAGEEVSRYAMRKVNDVLILIT